MDKGAFRWLSRLIFVYKMMMVIQKSNYAVKIIFRSFIILYSSIQWYTLLAPSNSALVIEQCRCSVIIRTYSNIFQLFVPAQLVFLFYLMHLVQVSQAQMWNCSLSQYVERLVILFLSLLYYVCLFHIYVKLLQYTFLFLCIRLLS